MGFGFKTTWIAVPNRSVMDVANALALDRRELLDWGTGIERAYREGIYVATPVPGWTLAHGRWHLAVGDLVSFDGPYVDWLTRLSRELGEVQHFVNERVIGYHGWSRAVDGEIIRAYAHCGDQGTSLYVGAPTSAEIELGKGIRPDPPLEDKEGWSDEDWDALSATWPLETDVMHVSGLWGVDPGLIDPDLVTEDGVFGFPVRVPPPTRT